MATSTTRTSDIQVIPFHNCKGCIDKVKREFRKLKGVQLIEVDPENGKFTFSTDVHPEVIRVALAKKFHKKSIILLPDEDIVLVPPSPTTEPSAPPIPASEAYVYGYPIGSTSHHFGR